MKLTRRTKLTDELTEYVCKYLKTGCFVKTVCNYCNLSPDTFYRWQKQGEKLAGEANLNKNEKQYVKFSEAVKAAQAESIVRHIMIINNAAQRDWRASAWFLERSFPAVYGQRIQALPEMVSEERQAEEKASMKSYLAELAAAEKKRKEDKINEN